MHDDMLDDSYAYHVSSKDKFKNVFDNIIKVFVNAMFIMLFAFLLILLFYSFYTKRYGKPKEAPLVSAYVIISPSMVPTINVLDAVVSIRPNIDKVDSGDIITFDSDDNRYRDLTVTHRVMKATGSGDSRIFNTKGDNNTTPDATEVKAKNVLGRVVFVIPWLGYLQLFLTKFYGWILLVVLPCIGMIVYDAVKLSGAVKRSKITKEMKFKNVEIEEENGNIDLIDISDEIDDGIDESEETLEDECDDVEINDSLDNFVNDDTDLVEDDIDAKFSESIDIVDDISNDGTIEKFTDNSVEDDDSFVVEDNKNSETYENEEKQHIKQSKKKSKKNRRNKSKKKNSEENQIKKEVKEETADDIELL